MSSEFRVQSSEFRVQSSGFRGARHIERSRNMFIISSGTEFKVPRKCLKFMRTPKSQITPKSPIGDFKNA
jgi:hypothetical protein